MNPFVLARAVRDRNLVVVPFGETLLDVADVLAEELLKYEDIAAQEHDKRTRVYPMINRGELRGAVTFADTQQPGQDPRRG